MKKKQQIQRHADLQKNFSSVPTHLKDVSIFRMVQESETDEELAFYKNVFRSDFFSLLWVVSGTVDISVNLKRLHAKAGDLVVAAPNAPKQLQNISEDCIIEGVTFTVDFLVALNLPQNHLDMMEFFASQYNPLWSLNDEERLLCSSLIASLQEKTTKMPDHLFGKEIVHNAFLIFLYEMAALSKKYAILNEASYNRKEELMLNFMRMASLHYKQEKNLAFYAKRLYVSSKHLSETVKEISTKTAGEILDDLIILESKLLLSDAALSISDIAAELNFSDRSFFGKFFKRHTGLSPRHYRQSLI